MAKLTRERRRMKAFNKALRERFPIRSLGRALAKKRTMCGFGSSPFAVCVVAGLSMPSAMHSPRVTLATGPDLVKFMSAAGDPAALREMLRRPVVRR